MTHKQVVIPQGYTPLFPLHTVLFPGGPLPLRIFETRYLDMVSDCLKHNSNFGVCLISDGKEVGDDKTQIHSQGTLARIIDWDMRSDGLLGITVQGVQRFEVRDTRILDNHLCVGQLELIDARAAQPMPATYQHLSQLLERLLSDAADYYVDMEYQFDSADWVSYRLVELLPIKLSEKQRFLEQADAMIRLEWLNGMLEGLEII